MLKKKAVKKPERWQKLFECLLLCNNANLRETKSGEFKPVGDPTEVALITLSEKAGFRKEQLEEDYERVEEIFFTGERKMMTTIHKTERGHTIFSKGAPEMILEKCTHQLVEGKKTRLSAKKKKEILNQNQDFAKQALRILAAAYKPVKSKKIPEKNVEEELIFLGLAAMKDPARVEVPEAIRKCKKAGIRVIMVTGDNAMTAKSTAAQIGIGHANNKVLTGSDIEKMNDSQMLEALKSVRVFARVHPEHKLRIVKLLKNQDEVVAMTGDGVNDAPALKSSDIGIAMGIKGTDVSKEAADMILQDDNFATIVTAVEEGRRIYHNIEKFTGYLISRNFTEVILILLGILFFDFEFLPLLAIQILLINAFAEEMPAIGLGLDKAHDKIMDKKPRNSDRSFLNQWNAIIVFGAATFMSMLNFIIFLWQDPVDNINLARTMVFSTILVMVIAGTYNFRSMRESVFVTGFSNNRFLIIAVGMIIAVTLSIVYWPPLQSIFSLTSIGPGAWLICIGAGLLNTTFLELLKLLRRKYERTDR
jgi:Ca2+-transporting ATPase